MSIKPVSVGLLGQNTDYCHFNSSRLQCSESNVQTVSFATFYTNIATSVKPVCVHLQNTCQGYLMPTQCYDLSAHCLTDFALLEYLCGDREPYFFPLPAVGLPGGVATMPRVAASAALAAAAAICLVTDFLFVPKESLRWKGPEAGWAKMSPPTSASTMYIDGNSMQSCCCYCC